jgi:predicted nucleic acid-binding protein
MILVDSDILIQYSRGDIAAAEWLETASKRDDLVISVVNEIELLFGSRDNRDLTKMRQLLATFEIIQIDEAISKRASFLVDKYCLSHRLEMPDAMIAATALVHGLELATINRKDFRYIDGLKLVDYP